MSDYKPTVLVNYSKSDLEQTSENRYWKKFKPIYSKTHGQVPVQLRVNDKRKLVCYSIQNSIVFYNYNGEKLHYDFKRERDDIRGFAVRRDGLIAAYGTSKGSAKVLDLKHKLVVKDFKVSDCPVYGIDVCDKLPLIAVADDGGNVEVKDFAAQMDIVKLPGLHSDFTRRVAFRGPDSRSVVTGSLDMHSKLIDLNTKEAVLDINNGVEVEDLAIVDDNSIALAGGPYVKIWDLRNVAEPSVILQAGVKTVTSVSVIGDRMITSSLDHNVKVFDISENYKLAFQRKFPSPIASFAASKEFKTYAVTLLTGQVDIYKRTMEEEQPDELYDNKLSEPERILLKRLTTGVNVKDTGSYRYYNRGIWDIPDEFEVKIGKPPKYNLQKYDKCLRQFKYAEALSSALKSKHSTVILTVVEELLVREGLEVAVKGLDDEYLEALIDFLLKKLDSWKSQALVVHLFDVVLDVRGDYLASSASLRPKLAASHKRLGREIQNGELALKIGSIVESLGNN